MAGFIDRIAVIIDASSSGAVKELEGLQKEAKKSGDAFDTLGKQMGLAGSTIKAGLAAGAAAVVGGGLIKLLNDSVDAFVESQEAARQWASLTNSSIQQAGKFTTVLKGYGIELNDLVEINAEFAAKIKTQPALLEKYNIAVVKAADGTTDMTGTLTNAISAISKIPDGVEKTSAALALFGEEGGKQLLPIINAGRDIKEAMEKINFVDNSEQAKDFAANSADLALSFQQVQIQLGNFLVPYLNDLMGIASGVVEFFSTLPGWVVDLATGLGIAAGAVLAFNGAMKVLKSDAVGTIIVGLLDGIGKIPPAFFEAETAMGKARVAVGTFGTALAGLAKAAAPLLIITGIFETFKLFSDHAKHLQEITSSTDNLGKSLKDLAIETNKSNNALEGFDIWLRAMGSDNQETQYAMEDLTASLKSQAQTVLENADATQAQKDAAQALLDVIGEGSDKQEAMNLATDAGTDAMLDFNVAMFGAAGTADKASAKMVDLADAVNDIVVNGAGAATTQEQLAAAVGAASEAQRKKVAVDKETARLMENIASATWDAYNATKAYLDQAESAEDSQRAFTTSIDGYKDAVAALEQVRKEHGTKSQEYADAEKAVQDAIEQTSDAGRTAAQDYVENLKAEETARGQARSDVAYHYEYVKALRQQALTPGLPAEAAAELVDEANALLAAVIRENNFTLPVGMTTEDVSSALTGVQADLDAAVASGANPSVIADLTFQRDTLTYMMAVIQSQIDGTPPPEIPAALVPLLPPGTDPTKPVTDAIPAEGVGMKISVDPDGSAHIEMEGLSEDAAKTVTVSVDFQPGGYEAVKSRLDYILNQPDASPDINVYTHFHDGGYEAVKARLDYIKSLDGQSPDVNIWTHFQPGGYEAVKSRLEYINSFDGKTPDINVYVHFNPSYETVKSRLDTLSRDRTATINVNTTGLAAAEASMRRLGDVTTTQRIILPKIDIPQPINIVKVNVDGKQLRATIRDELLRVRESDDLVAAMGTVA